MKTSTSVQQIKLGCSAICQVQIKLKVVSIFSQDTAIQKASSLRYCLAHPLDKVYVAADALIFELLQRARQR
jgi:hypothetical protein